MSNVSIKQQDFADANVVILSAPARIPCLGQYGYKFGWSLWKYHVLKKILWYCKEHDWPSFWICSPLMVFEVVCWDFEVVFENFVGATFAFLFMKIHEHHWTSVDFIWFTSQITNQVSKLPVVPENGLGLCQWLSQSIPYSKIIIISGYPNPRDDQWLMSPKVSPIINFDVSTLGFFTPIAECLMWTHLAQNWSI